MLCEINKDFYCSSGSYCEGRCLLDNTDGLDGCGRDSSRCQNYHRKWPTPEQFKEEYGEEYPDDGAVYVLINRLNGSGYWSVDEYSRYREEVGGDVGLIVCAATPFGKADNDWRP